MRSYFFLILFSYCNILFAQLLPTASLEDIIHLAQQKSLRSKVAQTRQEVSNYQFQIFKSNLKPQIALYGNLPGLNKEFATVTQPDGTIRFEPIQQSLSTIGIGLMQKIPFTGGEISFNSDLNRFRNIRDKNTLFNGTPFYVRLSQPLFGVNPFKWSRKIEPLKLEEAQKSYTQELNTIAFEATTLYFDLLQAQADEEIAKTNLDATTYNFELEQKRINLGTTSEDKLLQLELQMLNSRQQLEQARYRYEIGLLGLRTFLGNTDSLRYRVAIPEQLPKQEPTLAEALQLAHENRAEFVAFERKKLEAQQELAQAKAARQEVNLVASYGLNGSDALIGPVYTNTQSQQRFTVGFNVPIVNWGRRQAAYKTAEALMRLTEFTNALDQSNFDQEIITLYNNIGLLRKNILLAQTTDSVAARRFVLSNQLYQSGKLSITDLSISQGEKDNARRNYISALRNFWEAWFSFKRATGWGVSQ